MKVTCSSCGQAYNLDESKLPQKDEISIPCPMCKAEIKINRKTTNQEEISPYKTHKSDQTNDKFSDYHEFFDASKKVSIVYSKRDDVYNSIQTVVKSLGYEVRRVNFYNELAERLNYHDYDMLIIEQDTLDPDENVEKMLSIIHSLPRDKRRKLFVTIISLGGNSSNSYQAFSLGVNLTLSYNELHNLKDILKVSLQQNELVYRPFYLAMEKAKDHILY